MKQRYHNRFFWFNIYFLSIFGFFLLSQEARGESKESIFNKTYNQLNFERVVSSPHTASTSARDLLEAGVKSQKSEVRSQKRCSAVLGVSPMSDCIKKPEVKSQNLAQSSQSTLTRVTGVEIQQTPKGLELILKTVVGSQRLVPLILPEGNDLVIDILDATLAFSIRNGVEQLNPAEGINKITVNKVDENSIRVRISGAKNAPSAEVVPGSNLMLSINPQGTTARQTPDEEIEVIATSEAEDDNYYTPDANTTTKTDTPLRDTPASIQVIPQQVIEDQGATNVREILRNASGVNFSSAAGGRSEDFIIRGFQANIFRNGFRDNFYSTRTETELANIDRVEVLKGPASVLFGRAEPAGIINFVTKQPLREPFYEVSFTAGDFSFYRPSLDFSGPLTENGDLAYRLNVAYENAGSFRDGVQTERFFIAPTLSWQISDDTELSLEFSYLDDTRPVDRGLVVLSDNKVADIPISTYLGDPEPREDFGETRTELYLDHRFNDNLSLRSGIRYAVSTEDGPGATVQIDGPSEDDRNFPVSTNSGYQFYETFTFQNDLIGKFKTGSIEHTALFGLEYYNGFTTFEGGFRGGDTIDIFNPSTDFEFGEFESFGLFEDRENSFGIYLQDQIALLDNLQLVVGGRFDTYNLESSVDGEITETEADAFSPRVGLVYQPIEPVSIYASYTRSFTPATGRSADGEAFEPQRGTAYEIGVKTEIIKNRLSSTLAFYDTTLTNVATTDPNNDLFEIQTGEQNSQGIELDIAGEILPGWNIFAGYAYTDAKITEDNTFTVGNRLESVPEHDFNLWTAYTIQRGKLAGLGFGLGIFYVSESPGDIENSFFLDDYTRVDAALYYERANFKATLNFKNLFDVRYFEGSGREEVTPGDPFTLLGTVSVEF
jgi:iron complex outermembrane recepter protein